MASVANIDLELGFVGQDHKMVAAGACDLALDILWMDPFSHGLSLCFGFWSEILPDLSLFFD